VNVYLLVVVVVVVVVPHLPMPSALTDPARHTMRRRRMMSILRGQQTLRSERTTVTTVYL
jgi:hypothetical protein